MAFDEASEDIGLIFAAHAAVQKLDHEAMRQHRPVTRALAAEVLRSMST